MKPRWIAILMACAVALSSAGCQNQKKTTRKVTFEGPEKKTEIKLETTEKDKKDEDKR